LENLSQYIPFHLSIFLSIGISIGFYYPVSHIVVQNNLTLLVFALVILVYILSKRRKNRLFQMSAYVSIVLIGISAITSCLPINNTQHFSHYCQGKKTLIFQVSQKLKPNHYQDKYYVEVIQVNSKKVEGKLLLNLQKDSINSQLRIGDTFITSTTIQTINPVLNPYSFDYKTYLLTQQIEHQIFLTNKTLKPIKNKEIPFKIFASRIRESIEKKLETYNFPKEELGILKALTLGQRQDVSSSLRQDYARAGAIHLLAVSGLHVGILFLLLGFVLMPLKYLDKQGYLKTVIIILLLWGYALLTGMSASVVRAVTMFSFLAIGTLNNSSKKSTLHALFASYFFILLIRPLFLFDVGFQMSYSAVFAILLLQPKISQLIPKTNFKIINKIGLLFSVSLAATLGTLPLSLYYFHQFPGLFFVSNTLIIPFIGVIMGIGLFVILLATVSALPHFVVQAYSAILHVMNWFIKWISDQEQFVFQHITFPFSLVILSYILLIVGYQLWENYTKKRSYRFLWTIIVLQIALIYQKQQRNSTQEVVIFNKSKASLLGLRDGRSIQTFHNMDSLEMEKSHIITSYTTHEGIRTLTEQPKLPSVFSYNNTSVLLVDSLGIYQNKYFKPEIIWLTSSPEINIERLLKTKKPSLILADASNYKSYVRHWKKVCQENQTCFYDTATQGAFVMR